MSENLNYYFKQARSWADDEHGHLVQSRNRYQAAFLLGTGLNVVSIIALCILSQHQTIVPMVVHHYEHGIATVEPYIQKNPILNRAQIESDIVRYVLNRESYDESSYRTQFDLVNLLSNEAVQKDYLHEQDKANPSSPVALLNSSASRELRVYSVNFMDSILENENDSKKNHQNLAEVVFRLIDKDKQSGKTTETTFNALISWRYLKPSDSPELRWKNWDGFEVTRYSKQPRMEQSS